MNKIKLIFAGTAEIGAPLLRSLARDDRFDITLVITQEDRPSGRKLELKAPPVKKTSEDLDIPVFQPADINDEESRKKIRDIKAEAIVVIAYGQILNRELLNVTEKGCINIHASLLPKYRGASPIQCAIGNLEKETGVSLMQMAEKMDAGDVYSRFSIPIEADDNSVTLETKLAHLISQRIPDALFVALQGNIKPIPQNESEASYCHKISKKEGMIDWNGNAVRIEAQIRALTGWPGTYTFFNGKMLKIIEASYRDKPGEKEPGTVFRYKEKIAISAGNGIILPTHVQIEGKTVQSINDFINGNPDFINSKLTPSP